MITPILPRRLPIGVFDSGVGGLTVLRELRKKLPEEDFIYFGDTARVPYGSKSKEIVRSFALQIGSWLSLQPVKAIVVACNTASALALPSLHERMPVPVFGVIQPGAAAAVALSKTCIGVLATRATVNSDAYRHAIQRIDNSCKVVSVAAPLLVPIIEEGDYETPFAELIVEKYLAPLRYAHCDTLLLGCTHYPLLKPLLNRIWNTVQTIDSAEATAAVVAQELSIRNLANLPNSSDVVAPTQDPALYLTDAGGNFLEVAERFLGEAPKLIRSIPIEELEAAYLKVVGE